jgi:hypothetical protein
MVGSLLGHPVEELKEFVVSNLSQKLQRQKTWLLSVLDKKTTAVFVE